MKPLGKAKTKKQQRLRRRLRVRRKIRGSAERPRLAVFRSLKHIHVQLVDDDSGRTLVAASDLSSDLGKAEGEGKVSVSQEVGKLLAKKAKDAGIKKAVFDRSGYPYHGRVKAVADGAREAGLEL